MTFKALVAAAALGVAAFTTSAQAVTIADFQLDVTQAAGNTFAGVELSADNFYQITVSGTFTIRDDGLQADAEFFNVPSNPQNQTSSTEIGVGIFNGGSAQDIDFGDFSDTGEYSVILTGLTGTLQVFYADTFYDNNSGFLSVTVEDLGTTVIPLPGTAVLLLSGIGALALRRRMIAERA
ncbi:MAG: VPLPA-CTERM sorting domain-containing protein [Pseudomonadota bacterium]